MGLLDKTKKAIGMGSQDEDVEQVEETDFSEEFDEEDELEGFDEPEEEPELEWETPYAFCTDVLQEDGFSDMGEFVSKAMMFKIDQSPQYRDKIQSGINTMNSVTGSLQQLKDLKDDQQQRSMSDQVQDVRAANDLINELDRMEGREEEIVNEVIGVAKDFAESYKANRQRSRGIDSSTGVTREEF